MQETVAATGAEPVLRVVGLEKSFGGLKAVDDVSLEVYEGEILALVGDNGAGKSTLVRALAGAQPPENGIIEIDGAPRQLDSPRDASTAGIGCLHQGLASTKRSMSSHRGGGACSSVAEVNCCPA